MTFELYGTARLRAGIGQVSLAADRLGTALRMLAERYPSLRGDVIQDESLRPTFLASLNGETFLSDPDTKLHDADCVLLMAADAGG